MTKEEFMAKLQMVYVGDKNAFNELISAYDELQKRIDKAIEYISNETFDYDKEPVEDSWLYHLYKVREILQDEEIE